MAKVERHKESSLIAAAPSVQEAFGRSIIPNPVTLSHREQAAAMFELWNEWRARFPYYAFTGRSTWLTIRSSGNDPLYELMTSLPEWFKQIQR